MKQMNKNDIVDELYKIKEEGDSVITHRIHVGRVAYLERGYFDAWRNKVLAFIESKGIDQKDVIEDIKKLSSSNESSVTALQSQIDTLIDLIEKEYIDINPDNTPDYDKALELIFTRFHKIARQLRTRYSDRATLKITDEYDVQDLLHALLLLYFDDIRTEEWTPSYAGSCLRMDFLIKEIQTVIEVKKTRSSMSPKDLGEELIIDIEKYKSHPDCKQLYCFIYDPEGLLGNPTGIKNDLETQHKDFLKVFIKPE